MKKVFKELVSFLADRRNSIVVRREVVVKNCDPTYGLQESTVAIESLNFDALLKAIDDFADTFDKAEPDSSRVTSMVPRYEDYGDPGDEDFAETHRNRKVVGPMKVRKSRLE